MECSNGAVKTAFDIQVNGKRGPGRPKMTWKQLTEKDHREWKLSAIDPHDRDTWREICHACNKPVAWKGAHCYGFGPYICTLIKNPLMMMTTLLSMGQLLRKTLFPKEQILFFEWTHFGRTSIMNRESIQEDRSCSPF